MFKKNVWKLCVASILLLAMFLSLSACAGMFDMYTKTENGYILTFMYTDEDKEVTIPSTHRGAPVTGIELCAISSDNVISVTIPACVTNIEGGAFAGCINLMSIIIEEGNSVYHSVGNCIIETASKTLISGCKGSVIPADGSVTSIGEIAFWQSSLTNIAIPDTVTSIGFGAFQECNCLTSITIPNSVTSIDSFVFSECNNLTSITVAKGNPVYHSYGSCVIETDSKTLIVGCKASVIPADGSVTSIGSFAFYDCDSLTSIAIPDTVTSIGYGAFEECNCLRSIIIPNSVTNIEPQAFYGNDITIYCEAESQPSGWDPDWNYSNCPVVWGYKG